MDVYWGTSDRQLFLNYEEPVPLSTHFSELHNKDQSTKLLLCPGIRDFYHNIFVVKFPFDYNLFIDGENIQSTLFNQEFFDQRVLIRSKISRLFSLNFFNVFVSEVPLEMEVMGAFFSDNDFVSKTRLIPGKFDIGKWVRPIECAFNIKEGYDSIQIGKGDEYLYIRFLTNEKIKFKKFYPSDKFIEMQNCNINIKDTFIKPQKLSYYYNLYKNSKNHKLFLKEIKNNLM